MEVVKSSLVKIIFGVGVHFFKGGDQHTPPEINTGSSAIEPVKKCSLRPPTDRWRFDFSTIARQYLRLPILFFIDTCDFIFRRETRKNASFERLSWSVTIVASAFLVKSTYTVGRRQRPSNGAQSNRVRQVYYYYFFSHVHRNPHAIKEQPVYLLVEAKWSQRFVVSGIRTGTVRAGKSERPKLKKT